MKINKSIYVLFLLLAPGLIIAQEQVVSIDSMHVHDPSTLHFENEKYFMFSTGRGVKSVWSEDLQNWYVINPIFETGTWPEWVNYYVPDFKGHFWAPDVIFMNGLYHLYYSCSSFGKPTSAIGLTVNKTLDPESEDYKWEDRGVVIISSVKTDFNAIDPSLLKTSEGKAFMTYGSWHGGIAVGEIDTLTGKYKDPKKLVKVAGGNHEAWEAAALMQKGDDYFLLVNTGICCRGLKSTYEIVMGKSKSPMGPYLDKEGKDLNDGGGSLLLGSVGRIHGPGHFSLSEDGKVGIHYYDANDDGKSKYLLYELVFKDGWPRLKL